MCFPFRIPVLLSWLRHLPGVPYQQQPSDSIQHRQDAAQVDADDGRLKLGPGHTIEDKHVDVEHDCENGYYCPMLARRLRPLVPVTQQVDIATLSSTPLRLPVLFIPV